MEEANAVQRSYRSIPLTAACVAALLMPSAAIEANAQQVLLGHVPHAVASSHALSKLEDTTRLNIAIGLPLRNQNELDALLLQLSDPASPKFGHYLSAEQFAAQFGPTEQEYQALIHYHISCGRVASAISMRRKWIPAEGKLTTTSARGNDFGCSVCIMPDIVQDRHTLSQFSKPTRYGPRYLWNYLQRSALVLAHHPNADVVTAEAFVLKDMDCSICSTNKRREMLDCGRAFAAEIRRAIEQVGGHLVNSCWHR